MTTVNDIWRRVMPPDIRLLGGEAGLGSEVSRAVTLKSRPPGLPQLEGGEFVLISMRNLQLLDGDLSLARVLESMAGTVAAVAVLGPVSDEAVVIAQRAATSLFVLPPATRIKDLEHSLTRSILEMRTEWYAFRHSVLHELTDLAARGRGLAAIAKRMAVLTGKAVVVTGSLETDPIIEVPSSYAPAEVVRITEFAHGHAEIEERPESTPAAAHESRRDEQVRLWRLTAIAGSPGSATALISLIGSEQVVPKEAAVVLEAGMAAVNVELSRVEAAESAARRLGGDLVSELIRGEARLGDLAERVRHSGIDLNQQWMAIALEHGERSGQPKPAEPHSMEAVAAHIRRRLKAAPANTALHHTGDTLTVFFSVEGSSSPTPGALTPDQLCLEVVRSGRLGPMRAGVSRSHRGAWSFRDSYREAWEALRMGRQLRQESPVTYFSELGIHRLLFGLQRPDQLRDFHDGLLGDLESYDRARESNLLETLEAWLEGPNANETAKRLNLHRNTLSYRLRRIGEITGVDLEEPETRFELRLALRIRQVLAATPEA